MTSIVGVHGIGNYHYFRNGRVAEISADWSRWLGSPVEVAYYAQHLHRGVAQGAEEDPGQLEPGEQEMLVALVEELGAEGVALGPRTARARQAAEWLTRKHGRTARMAAMAFCREAHTYLARPESKRRAAARAEVAETITRCEPRVVVAHSLGSIVTYEALWAHPELSVELLVTIGSPLGMHSVVFDRLLPTPNGRGRRPRGVGSWVNLADVGDIFAVPKDLPARFDGIFRHASDLRIGDWDFHTARNYLGCPEVAATVHSG